MAASIATLLRNAHTRLTAVSDTPRLEAEVLLAYALQKPRSHLHAWPAHILDSEQVCSFIELVERRLTGEPVAYILGRREFWSLDLMVTSATLIPRPETERLVELALERIPRDRPMRVADLGTGSGAIALAIARERPQSQVVATDLSMAALQLAERNARRLAIHNIGFFQGDWCSALGAACFNAIVANPPYLPLSDYHLEQGDLRFEPRTALTAGHDGLDAIRLIAAGAMDNLYPGGWLLLEHGYDQGEKVAALLSTHGFETIGDHKDDSGINRVMCGCRPVD